MTHNRVENLSFLEHVESEQPRMADNLNCFGSQLTGKWPELLEERLLVPKTIYCSREIFFNEESSSNNVELNRACKPMGKNTLL